MKKMVVSKSCQQQLKQGKILLKEQDLSIQDGEDQLVQFYSQEGHFLATGYLSKQNKGIGWILSTEKKDWTWSDFVELVQAARVKRRIYFEDQGTTAFRLFNQEGDGFPGLTVDVYGDFLLFSWYNAFVYQNRDAVTSAFKKVYPDYKGAYEKVRFKGMDYETGHLYGEEAPDQFLVKENGVSYEVFLNDGWMTGIFLDQHDVRKDLAQGLAQGKSLLNLFSYTAAFSVAAAIGGARESISVDLAKRSRDLSKVHFEANGLGLDDHRFVVMDTFEYLRYAGKKGLRFDLIVIDPPSFARNKKKTFSVTKDYHRLVQESRKLLKTGGQMILSTNAAQFSLEQFKKEIKKGMGEETYQIEQVYRLPQDFPYSLQEPSSNYLKVVRIKVDK